MIEEEITEGQAEGPSEDASIRDTIAAEIEKIDPGTDQEAAQDIAPERPRVDFIGLGFKKDTIPKLEGLPDDVVQALVERDASYKAGMEKYQAKAQLADEFTRALQPHSEYLDALEVTPADYIPALVQTEMVLRLGSPQQKAEMFQRLAHDYGVDLGVLAQLPFDPNTYRLQQEINVRDRQLQNLQRTRQDSEQGQILGVIGQWAEDKEYFDEVRGDMALLLETGKAQDLDQAYKMAIRLSDGVFEKYQAKQFADLKKADALKANQLAKQAKASAVQVNGRSSGATMAPELRTAEDSVRWAMAQHGL